ncbi:Regulator of nonsense transcripts 1 like protein [Cucumispora dikerogammari]|nr:Regulator of nonsense transcripts 1 like protein [Cucumispora dikerogammari]
MSDEQPTPINTEISTQNICEYCAVTASCMQCNECEEFFCNRKITTSSHIILHFIKELHNQIRLKSGNLLICHLCKQTNFFNLGTYEDLEDKTYGFDLNFNLLTCRTCHEYNSENHSNPGDFKCFVSERSVIPLICPVYGEMSTKLTAKSERSKYDELTSIIEIHPIPIQSGMKFYQENFTNMIILEGVSELSFKEKMAKQSILVNVSIMNKKRKVVSFVSPVDKSFLCLGDEIRLYRTTEKIGSIFQSELKMESFLSNKGELSAEEIYELLKSGYKQDWKVFSKKYDYAAMCVISKIDKLIEVDIIKEKGEISNKLNIQFVWNGCNFSRMLTAINKLGKTKSFIKEIILRGKNDENPDNIKHKLPVFKSIKKLTINLSQQRAIDAALNNRFTLIQGPPGTGKSLCVAIIAYNLSLKGKVLICAPSNVAIDNLSFKLLEFSSKSLKIIRVLSKCRELLDEESSETPLSAITLHNILKKQKKEKSGRENKKGFDERKLVEDANIIICTCMTAGKKMFESITFDYVIIDESVQGTEPTTLIPLLQAKKKCILVGDHMQLGPIIMNNKLIHCKYNRSLFERLILSGIQPMLLSVQYRMNHQLCEWPSNEFYGGLIITDLSVKTRKLKTKDDNTFLSTFFWCSLETEECSMSGTSYLNVKERDLCKELIAHLTSKGVKSDEIGIITPYEGQRTFISASMKDLDIEVASIDAFQGREKEFIIFSSVRSNSKSAIGFLNDRRRLNVALTRAKSGLYIIGNPFTLMEDKTWLSLLKFYQKANQIVQGNISNLKQIDLLIKEPELEERLAELSLKERFNFDLPL